MTKISKEPSSSFTTMVRPNPHSLKSTAYLKPLQANGLSNTQRLKPNRGEPDYVLFHSNQGSEYTAFTFRQALERCNAVQSFSKKGYPYDNTCCESFFRHMKRECINRKTFHNQEGLRLCCFEYINRYNTKRPLIE